MTLKEQQEAHDLTKRSPRILLIMIEPAPYIIRLIESLMAKRVGSLRTVFVSEAVSQDWPETRGLYDHEVLPEGHALAIRGLASIYARYRPDLVHVAGWGNPVVIAAIILARLVGASIVSSSDTWISDSGGVRSSLKRAILRQVNFFACAGSRQVSYLCSLGVQAEKISQVNMTVDVTAIRLFHRQHGESARTALRGQLGVKKEDVLVLSVGRLGFEKGVDILIDAYADIGLDASVKLYIVGDGAERATLEAQAANIAGVTFAGRLSGAQLWRAYAAADVFVGASRREAWGLVVNEAMAAGLPVILSDRFGCIDDLLVPGETGLLVSAGDTEELSYCIRHLAADPLLRASMRKSTLRLIENWTIENQAVLVDQVWEKALRKRPIRK